MSDFWTGFIIGLGAVLLVGSVFRHFIIGKKIENK